MSDGRLDNRYIDYNFGSRESKVTRFPVEGGWLYKWGNSVAFVPFASIELDNEWLRSKLRSISCELDMFGPNQMERYDEMVDEIQRIIDKEP